MSTSPPSVDTGTLLRRTAFFLVLILLTLGNLFVLFRGLNAPHAMEQAQIAREVARGNGFTTKMIRPVAYYQAETHRDQPVQFTGFKDTYHSPLNPLINAVVLKVIGADDGDAWQMGPKEMIFPLDRVIATVCTLFFLLSIGVSYLLISRIFDPKIAGVTAILMLFCEAFWNYSLSGLPQMLMLFLFSCGAYFAYRAVEASTEGRSPMTPALIAGVFFTLLSLSHWMTVWIALGYIIFAAVAFRPRGVIGISVLVLLLLASIYPMIRANEISGSPFGTAYLTLYGGLASGSEETVMRTHDLEAEPLSLEGLLSKIVRTTLLQSTDIIPFLGGIIVAPLFFLSLLHVFKRAPIAQFRWLILLMFISAAIGLSLYGITTDSLDPNQIHLVFAPIMTAYGLAFVSILWSRLEIVAMTPFLRNIHHIIIVFICAAPLVITLPTKIRFGMDSRDSGGVPHWPPYFAPRLNLAVKQWVPENQIVVADQPWAVAWYADRMSLWIPPTKDGFVKYENAANDLGTPFAGIVISPVSHGTGGMTSIAARYRDFTSLVIDGSVMRAVGQTNLSTFRQDNRIADIAQRYPNLAPLVDYQMVFYMNRQIRLSDSARGQ